MNDLYFEVMNQIQTNEELCSFFNTILKHSDLYLFGGAARNYLDNDFENIRDLDFVVKFRNNYDTLETYISNSISFSRNSFNGYKLMCDNVSIDIWEMENTWAFKQKKLTPSPENLLKSVFLNVDSVVYSMNQKRFVSECDYHYKDILDNKILDIVLEENPSIELNLLRALVLQQRYELNFSNNLKSLFSKYQNNINFIDTLLQLQKKHYKKQIFTRERIENVLKTY